MARRKATSPPTSSPGRPHASGNQACHPSHYSGTLAERFPPTGLLRLLLRLPNCLYRLHLGWLLGSRFLLLAHRGRRSGRWRQTVVEVVQHNPGSDTYFIASGWGEKSNWASQRQGDTRGDCPGGQPRVCPAILARPATRAMGKKRSGDPRSICRLRPRAGSTQSMSRRRGGRSGGAARLLIGMLYGIRNSRLAHASSGGPADCTKACWRSLSTRRIQ